MLLGFLYLVEFMRWIHDIDARVIGRAKALLRQWLHGADLPFLLQGAKRV